MQKKKDIIVLFTILAIFSGLWAAGMLVMYFVMNTTATLYKQSPKLQTKGSISEYQNDTCWIRGELKADDPKNILISFGAKKPCVYYHFVSEYLKETTDSEGNTSQTWTVSQAETKYAHAPLLVENEKYVLSEESMHVAGGLLRVLDVQEKRGGTAFHVTEDIIPDQTKVWILGIPRGNAIYPTKVGLVITIESPEKLITEARSGSIIALLVSIGCFVLTLVFTGLVIRKRSGKASEKPVS